jgi:hypothetical protein
LGISYSVWRRILRLGRRGDTKDITVLLQDRESFEGAQIKFIHTVGKYIIGSQEKHRYEGMIASSNTSGKHTIITTVKHVQGRQRRRLLRIFTAL